MQALNSLKNSLITRYTDYNHLPTNLESAQFCYHEKSGMILGQEGCDHRSSQGASIRLKRCLWITFATALSILAALAMYNGTITHFNHEVAPAALDDWTYGLYLYDCQSKLVAQGSGNGNSDCLPAPANRTGFSSVAFYSPVHHGDYGFCIYNDDHCGTPVWPTSTGTIGCNQHMNGATMKVVETPSGQDVACN